LENFNLDIEFKNVLSDMALTPGAGPKKERKNPDEALKTSADPFESQSFPTRLCAITLKRYRRN
jgi:hypothetical protein